MKATVTRKSHFNSAHRLHNPLWTDEKNTHIFGKCANPNYHGHNYDLLVSIKGEIDTDTGYVVDLKLIDTLIKKEVIEKFDHKNLNLDVDFMLGKMTSTEIVAMQIWNQLEVEINKNNCILHCIKLFETERNFVEYYGS